MDFKHYTTEFSVKRYKAVTVVMALITLVLAAFIPGIKVDTDPENMLEEDEPVRLFHDKTKERFQMYDMVVLGVVNNTHPNGVFNPQSLGRIYQLTEFAKTLRWPSKEDPEETVGVIEVDLLAPSTVDHISQGGPGTVKFEWLMKTPPETQQEATRVKQKALTNPLLKNTVVAEDGNALCVYMPLTSKDLSYKVYSELQQKIRTFDGNDKYHITGLPVAEDTFGYQMFIQMAISAPLAMLVIFLLMLVFFRKIILIISPMIVALVSVITTMGLLIGLGFPVHIMSSMIPIFLMPIAVVDSIHILSEFFDLYTKEKGRVDTIYEVMDNLFMPMLYTSLTSAAGFASLALTPIPPVQVFGIFVALGIMIAWLCTVTFVPAYVMFLSEKSLENFGAAAVHEQKQTWLTRILNKTGSFTYNAAKPILAVIVIIIAVAVYGITQIRVNDNPIKWFEKEHPVRVADTVLNKHIAGTYMAYLVFDDTTPEMVTTKYVGNLRGKYLEALTDLDKSGDIIPQPITEMEEIILDRAEKQISKEQYLKNLIDIAYEKAASASEESYESWYDIAEFFENQQQNLQLFKNPQTLAYISKLQKHIEKMGLVGKTNSVADIVKKVHQELIDGKPENYIIPGSANAVAQCLIQFQSSHTPDDLWHFVTTDYKSANIWFQLKSGDNKDMEKVVAEVNQFIKDNPSPVPIEHNWAGLTYINIIWQDKMVSGMLKSLLGSFIIVFLMMSILFRSPLWGIVCMIPLSVTIAVIYGIIGMVGKDYDMPVAVLSALTLGMAVDFAIHFLQRARENYTETFSWAKSAPFMFDEPARAISRNVLVIAIGFLPLLAAPLVPYQTVGFFLCAIMALSGIITLLALPAILTIAEHKLFHRIKYPHSVACNCAFCVAVSFAVCVLIAMNIHHYTPFGWNKLAWITIAVISLMALSCGLLSRRRACRIAEQQNQKKIAKGKKDN